MTSNLTDTKEIRKFGAVAFVFFGVLSGVGIWREAMFASIFFGVLFFLGVGFVVAPGPMTPVYRAWLFVAHAIGRGVTTVILGLAFYLVITPSGLLKKIFGGTPLPMRPDADADTYWVDRTEPAQPKERFLKRF